MITTMKRFTAAAALAMTIAMAGTTQAAMIGINLTGFQVQYVTDANRANDLKSEMIGNKNEDQAVKLSGTEFMVDDVLIAQYSAMGGQDTYADLRLDNVSPDLFLPANPLMPSVAQSDNNGSIGLEWFYDDGGVIRSLTLRLETTSLALLATGNPSKPTFLITGMTTDFDQSHLPGGIQFTPGSPISFSYTTTNTMPFDVVGNNFVALLASGGVMEISGEGSIGVPEPASVGLLLSLGGIAAFMRWRLG